MSGVSQFSSGTQFLYNMRDQDSNTALLMDEIDDAQEIN